MAARSQSILFLLTALASLSCVSLVHGEEKVLTLAPGRAMTMKVPGVDRIGLTAVVGDTDIADVTFGPQNAFIFQAKKEGSTNVIVLDDSGSEIFNSQIEVRRPSEGNRIIVHNKALLTSFTIYRCDPRCEYVNEIGAKEPAPLPRGFSSQNLNQTESIDQNVQQNTTTHGQ